MNERLAFFCTRDTAPCHLYTWARPDAGGDLLYQVYCRSAPDTPRPGTDGAALTRETIHTWLAAANGGLVAETRQANEGTQLRVTAIPAVGADPATELLVLRPGQEPAWQPLANGTIDMGPGAFVLLPPTATDQSNLLALLQQLNRLPGDYRDLLLNVLRRPGLEGALWRLERRLERLDDRLSPATTGTDRRPAPRMGVVAAWPWVVVGLLALNLFATFGSAWWLRQSPDPAAPPPTYSIERLRIPAPGPDWSWCGPPWFCKVPLAPPARGPAGGGPLYH